MREFGTDNNAAKRDQVPRSRLGGVDVMQVERELDGRAKAAAPVRPHEGPVPTFPSQSMRSASGARR